MDKNENNNLIDVNTPRSDTENDNENENDLLPPQILLSPEQQKKLEEHLTPPTQSISDSYYNNNNNNNNKFDLNKASDNNNEGISGGSSGDEKEKKKKKKKKDKKKKNKNKSTDNEEEEDIEDIDKIVIKSPILLKSRKSIENQHHDPYSTEMSPVKSSTPQIDVDPEMYFDAGKKEKKKKKKNGGGGNKDKFLTPEERRIKENSKDAKSFFSNERTFLSWIGLTFSLGAIGTAIITWFGSEGVSLATGVFLWAIAMVFMVYSTLQFRRRGHAIRTKTQGPFDDQKGPLSLVAMVVVGVSIYLVFFVVIRPTVNIGGETVPSGSNSTKDGL